MKGILGRKVEMTQIFATDGRLIPVTVVEVLPNTVLQVKNLEKDGYIALQLGVQDKRVNLVNKPEIGHFNKANSAPKRFVKEIRNMDGFEQGQQITASDIFENGQLVDVTGTSKGKGFQGSIKRHNYARGPMGHGSGYHRGTGSMGAIINRIFKSKKMPGHMGHAKRTIQNLEVVLVDNANNIMLIKGSIPGPKGQFVTVRQNVKGLKANQAAELLIRKEAVPAIEPTVEPTVAPVVETEAEVETTPAASAE
ncbi:50S ribosomal protein L3 [Williamsoniiplasma luminosum]|uniref:Large ribosomal subunit protein uL3 n=1 Tax=Williamsoniiplasma luminosum TaxID=214888 RepID=A0A2K8NWK4_9MOLU|nr:50S ribosomal protein L3 [Williamsoniiplasma luminosum]ATZ17003.1 50S ribosomal protein L3 [Williamsoniiplasma luminosum]AVP49668.1 MAG: 50S ribosomal protein L3 [Williamsoniiplasma luminosum]